MPREQTSLRAGDPAPDFTLASADGRPTHLAALQGHPVALFFFRGTW
jgi:peroxiredoxin